MAASHRVLLSPSTYIGLGVSLFGGDLWEVAMVTPLYLHFPDLLIACFAVNWHLPSTINKLNEIINNQS